MNIALLSAVEQLKLLHEGKLSPSELAEEHIRRIERLNPLLNAIVDFDPDRVREQAVAPCEGPIRGLPITIKSSIRLQSHKCEVGSTLWRGQVAQEDAVAVSLLREAGAVFLGSTNCPEFLMAYETDNLLYGRTNNPWDLDCTAGGSSGGEAAAIAAGLSSAGLGSDSGGSVREPAHFTGICALKPTSGRVSSIGHIPPCIGPFSTLGAVGPMARTMADVELIFRVTSTHDHVDARKADAKYRLVSLKEATEIPIAWFEDDGLIPVTQETRRLVRSAAAGLAAMGFKVKQIRPLPSLEAARRLWEILFVQCGAMLYEPTIRGRRDQLSPVFTDFLLRAESRDPLTATSLLQAWTALDEVRFAMLEEMREHPLLLTPVSAVPAFRHGEREWSIDGTRLDYLDAMRFTQWFNVLGAPAAVVPVGKSSGGLPIGVQIAGRPYQDELVIAVAKALDSQFGYDPPPFAMLEG